MNKKLWSTKKRVDRIGRVYLPSAYRAVLGIDSRKLKAFVHMELNTDTKEILIASTTKED